MLVSLDDMKTYLGIELIDTTHDAFLTEQLVLMSSTIENYCGRKFEQASYTQTFYKEDFNQEVYELPLYLYHYPLISITTLTETISGTADILLPSEYRLHLPTAKVYRLIDSVKSPWVGNGDASSNVVVVFEAGYATIPAEIDSVVKSLVAERYNKNEAGVELNFGTDVQRVSIPGTIAVDFDYSLQSNERKNGFGMILGNYLNVLDFFRSEKTLIGSIKENYVS